MGTSLNNSWNDNYPFIAHPKIDRFNDDNLLVIGHDTEKGAALNVGMFDKEQNLLKQAEIDLQHAQEVHDMSATEHFIVLFDFNVWFGADLFEKYGTMFQFESNITSRIGLLDKN